MTAQGQTLVETCKRGESGRAADSMQKTGLSLIGAGEIADMAQVTRAAVSNWRRRSADFPQALARLKSGPVFYRHEIVQWLRKRAGNATNVISFLSVRSGAGKTTSILALADKLSFEHQKRVLVIDLDPRSDASAQILGERQWRDLTAQQHMTVADVFLSALSQAPRYADIRQTIIGDIATIVGGTPIALLPSISALTAVYVTLSNARADELHYLSLSEILFEAVSDIVADYDYILVDCPAGMNIMTRNALAISNVIVTVVVPNARSIAGVGALMEQLGEATKGRSGRMHNLGILLSKRLSDSFSDQDAERALRDGGHTTILHASIGLAKARLDLERYETASQTVEQKYGSGPLSREYSALCDEMLGLIATSNHRVADLPSEFA